MLPYLSTVYANPSSIHRLGRVARSAIDHARNQVAHWLGAHPTEVVFTSGGTEANTLAIFGSIDFERPGVLAYSSIEHASVHGALQTLGRRGFTLSEIPVDCEGRLDLVAFSKILDRNPVLVSVMWANNETGVIQDIPALSRLTRARGLLLHSDAVQAAGKIEVNFADSGVDLLTVSAHKIYGPKGVGALVVDKRVDLQAAFAGGSHERGIRAGTENLAGIVGLGQAAELAALEWRPRYPRLLALREQLEGLLGAIPGARIFSEHAPRLPNTVQFAIPGVEAGTLLLKLDQQGIAVSGGSACSSGQTAPNRILSAMGVEVEQARAALRVSLGEESTSVQITHFVQVLQRNL